jgi:hypothetical protein
MSTTPSPVWPTPEAASDPVRQPAARRSAGATTGMLVGVALVGAVVGVAADRLILNAPSLGNTLPAAIGRVLPRTEPAAAPPAGSAPATQAPPSAPAPAPANPAPANPGRSAPAAPANPAQPPADATQQAIQATIQKSNEAQAQAVTSKDLAGLAEAATADFGRQMREVTQDLIDGGVKAIKLDKIEWGPISVTGTTATATSFETWSTTFADGTTEVQRDRNVYTLVQQDGTWKIQSNTHPDALPSLPGLPDPGLLDPFQRRQPMPLPGFN